MKRDRGRQRRKARRRGAIAHARQLIEHGFPKPRDRGFSGWGYLAAKAYTHSVILNADWLAKIET